MAKKHHGVSSAHDGMGIRHDAKGEPPQHEPGKTKGYMDNHMAHDNIHGTGMAGYHGCATCGKHSCGCK